MKILWYKYIENGWVYFFEGVSFGSLLCHQVASDEPVMFIIGPYTAGANPTVASFPMVNAMPDASPPFCIPTSKEIVQQSFSFMENKRADQYPRK
jgi:hypothetical protein